MPALASFILGLWELIIVGVIFMFPLFLIYSIIRLAVRHGMKDSQK